MKRLLVWGVFAVLFLGSLGQGAVHAASTLSVVIAPPQMRLLPILKERFARHRWDASIEQRPSVMLAGVATEDASTLKVFVDLQTAGWARLVFVQPGGQRFSIRDLSFAQGLNEVAFETIGLVVDSAVDSLFSGLDFELSRNDAQVALQKAPASENVSTPPAPVPAPVAAPVAAPVGPRPVSVRQRADAFALEQKSVWSRLFAAGYTASPQGSEALSWLSGPTLLAAVHSQRSIAQLELAWLPPAEIQGTAIGGALTGGSARVSWGAYRQRGSFALCAMPVRMGIDVMKLNPQIEQPAANAMAGSARTFVSPMIGAGFGVFWSASQAFTVAAYLSADLDLLGTNFSANNNGNSEIVAHLWRVRPAITLVAGWGG